MFSEAYDYIIVGGGTAGLVLAARLSEDPNVQVLVLEAGEDQTSDPRVTTPAMWAALLGTPANWDFSTTPQGSLSGRSLGVPQGRLLGGSSGLNGMVFTVNSRSNVEAWGKLGNPGWNWDAFYKCLTRAFTLEQPSEEVVKQFSLEYIDETVHGASGPLKISFPTQLDNEWPRVWLDTLTNTGSPLRGNPFSGEATGVFINAETIDATTRQRSFSASAYLEQIRHRTNLTVTTGATVEKIVFDQSVPDEVVAKGVQVAKDGKSTTIMTRKEVILTAGPINSPRLLELSGVGDPEVLKTYGVDVVVKNPAVGENLQNHPFCTICFEIEDEYENMDGLVRQDPAFLAAAMEQYMKQTGPFASSNTFTYAQLPVPGIDTVQGKREIEDAIRESENYVDDKPILSPAFVDAQREYVHSVLTSQTEGSGCHLAFPGYIALASDGSMAPIPPGNEKYLTIGVLLAHPLSRGSVHISKDAPKDLAVDPRYFSHPLDVEIMARHMQFVEQGIAATEPMASRLKKGGKRNASAPLPGSFADLQAAKDYVLETAVGAHHYTGTCAMMPREMGGVVDSRLRVYGCRNLRVCDSSIIPLTPRTNTQSTVYAVAEMAADIIKSA